MAGLRTDLDTPAALRNGRTLMLRLFGCSSLQAPGSSITAAMHISSCCSKMPAHKFERSCEINIRNELASHNAAWLCLKRISM